MQPFIPRFFLVFVLSISYLTMSFGQEPVIEPLDYNPVLRDFVRTEQYQQLKAKFDENQTKSNVALTLPFIDDFSNPGPYPNPDKWVDNDAFINNDLGFEPPTIGVATFDGLDGDGLPHPEHPDDYADILTSQPISLDGNDLDVFYFSFWYQLKGNSFDDWPDNGDKFMVEFKTESGEWEVLEDEDSQEFILEGCYWSECPDDTEPFVHQIFSFNKDTYSEYFHANFQFRFTVIDEHRDYFDFWHIDYVVLSENPPAEIMEVAFHNPTTPLLNNYSSMPWEQFDGFEDVELATQNMVAIFNSNDVNTGLNSACLTIQDNSTQTILLGSNDTDPSNLNHFFFMDIDNLNVPSGINEYDLYFNTTVFPQNIIDFSTDECRTVIESKYSFEVNNSALDVIDENNTVIEETIFEDYFAYDDGIANGAIGFSGGGSFSDKTAFALKFHNNKETLMHGIRMYHSRRNVNSNTYDFDLYESNETPAFIIRIYLNNLNDSPYYELEGLKNQIPRYVNELQGFTPYYFVDKEEFTPISIPANTDFYVEIQWLNGPPNSIYAPFSIGGDYNIPAPETFFFNGGSGNGPFGTGGLFVPVETIFPDDSPFRSITPMIRPFFSNKSLDNLAVTIQPVTGVLCENDHAIIDVDICVEGPMLPDGSPCLNAILSSSFEPNTPHPDYNNPTFIFNEATGMWCATTKLYIGDNAIGDEITFKAVLYTDCGIGYAENTFVVQEAGDNYPLEFHVWNDYLDFNETVTAAEVFAGIDEDKGFISIPTTTNTDFDLYEFLAFESITLLPDEGFEAPYGSSFLAMIIPDMACNTFENLVAADDRSPDDIETIDVSSNSIHAFPNPFSNNLEFEYSIAGDAEQEVSIYLMDVTGKEVATVLKNRHHQSGSFSVQLENQALPPGIYFCNFIVNDERTITKLIKI